MKQLAASTRTPATIALALTLVVIWLLTHRYQGLAQDARIYAVQALARINPQLQGDLYLQNTSQDRYTFFSPFYASVIRVFGLQDAARILTVLFAAWFLAAAWDLARTLIGANEAWLAVGALILTAGAYGSYGVFHFSEDYLTARSAAEALTITSFALHARGFSLPGLLIATFALLVHPLMALPGVLLMIFWMVSPRTAALLAVAGITLVLAVAMAASLLPRFELILPRLDGVWLHLVKERSQFLFLQLWSLRDWEVNVRPFATLALAATVLLEDRVNKLCVVAVIVGASGLIVALLAGILGDVAILIQGQAWRWVWITACVSAILLIPTAMRLWQTEKSGPLCAVLLAASWTLSAGDAPFLAVVAYVLFSFRAYFPDAAGSYLKAAAVLFGMALVGWQLTGVVSTASSVANAGTGISNNMPSTFLGRTSTVWALRFPIGILMLGIWHLMTTSTRPWLPSAMSLVLGAACTLLIPIAFAKVDAAGSALQVAEFADWQEAIPLTANVYVADGHDAASFAWFNLRRPSYLSLDQSAGVIFSRTTATEVARRSLVLLPLMDEDWKLLSRNTADHRTGTVSTPRRTPMTAASLVSMCRDPQLGFLIAREDVGFAPLQHRQPGPWMHWNLYNCAHVRSLEPNG